jgi:hypothetical protein
MMARMAAPVARSPHPHHAHVAGLLAALDTTEVGPEFVRGTFEGRFLVLSMRTKDGRPFAPPKRRDPYASRFAMLAEDLEPEAPPDPRRDLGMHLELHFEVGAAAAARMPAFVLEPRAAAARADALSVPFEQLFTLAGAGAESLFDDEIGERFVRLHPVSAQAFGSELSIAAPACERLHLEGELALELARIAVAIDQRLSGEAEAAKRRLAAEQAERERRAAEERERAARAEQERAAREQAERAQAERERIAREEAERERLERERVERERVERESLERERAERERLEREKVEEQRVERERLDREKAERERIERERIERERAERERVVAEQAERERILAERERAVAERERLLAERATREADLSEKERLERGEPSAEVLGKAEEPAVSHASTLLAPSRVESTAPAPVPPPPFWRIAVEVVVVFLGAFVAVVAAGFVIVTFHGCDPQPSKANDRPGSEHAPSQDAH